MTLSAFAALGLGAGGCAHLGQSKRSGSPSDQIIKPDPKIADPLTALEQELTKVHSDRVTVSTALLKSLVKNERRARTHCQNISGQLEAIKNIDLEETGSAIDDGDTDTSTSKEEPKE
jgi:hypothetical protein